MGYSQDERLALCVTLEKAGPDAPTLCAGWTTRDLAAHLVLRERRPDAAAGIPGGPLAGHTAKVQQRLAATPYPALLATIRSGPPRLSPFAIPALDERVNTVEFFVHNVLWASGRTRAAQVRLDGTAAATAMLSQATWRL